MTRRALSGGPKSVWPCPGRMRLLSARWTLARCLPPVRIASARSASSMFMWKRSAMVVMPGLPTASHISTPWATVQGHHCSSRLRGSMIRLQPQDSA